MNPESDDYADVWYTGQRLTKELARASLTDHIETDFCVIGGGLAGVSAVHDVVTEGGNAVLLEAKRIGWGASGRNGGFVSPGYALGYQQIARKVGVDAANLLHAMSLEGISIVRDKIAQLSNHDAQICPGIISAVRYNPGQSLTQHRDWLANTFNYDVEHLEQAALREHLTTAAYHQGLLDANAFHFNPLAHLSALTHDAQSLGAQIFETSPVKSIQKNASGWRLQCNTGSVQAREVLIATGGYTGGLVPELDRAFLPIATYVMVTRPAKELIANAIHTHAAIGDNRRAGDYYRLVDQGRRVLWGGKITTQTQEPTNLARLLHQSMTDIFPQLQPLEVELAWSGLMSYARHKMPQIGKLPSGLWYCTAFGGHGMNTSSIGGRVIAEAILGTSDRYRHFAPFPLDWTGGVFGRLAVQLTYWQLQAMDQWRERH